MPFSGGGGGGDTLPIVDTTGVVKGSADATKILRFEVDGLTTATTRVATPPNEDFTIVGVATAQTLTNKTLTSPKINEDVAITATATELNYTDGVTSAIQTQLDALASPTPRISMVFPLYDYVTAKAGDDTNTGTGANSTVKGGVKCNTGATDGSRAIIQLNTLNAQVVADNFFDRNPFCQAQAILSSDTTTAHVSYLGFNHNNLFSNAGASTVKHIGFVLDTTVLLATNANGTTQTTTDISSGVTIAANTINTYACVMTSGTNVKFYVNGVLKATHTTNLPSGALANQNFGYHGIDNDTGVTTDRSAYIGQLIMEYNAF